MSGPQLAKKYGVGSTRAIYLIWSGIDGNRRGHEDGTRRVARDTQFRRVVVKELAAAPDAITRRVTFGLTFCFSPGWRDGCTIAVAGDSARPSGIGGSTQRGARMRGIVALPSSDES